MAVNSLRYRPNANAPDETKSGFVIYAGSAYEFHHWAFRTEMKMKVCKEEDVPRTASQVVESLRGEALSLAMSVGITELTKDDGSGVTKLISAVRDYIFPVKEEESKALYRELHKIGGVLSRQSGEPVQSYITRRKRGWTLLKELDPTVTLTDEMRGDMLLDNAGLSELDKRMILTSTANKTNQELIEAALLKQHGKRLFDGPKPPAFDGKKFHKKPFFKKRVANVGYQVDTDGDGDEGYDEEDAEEPEEAPDDDDNHVEDELEAGELDLADELEEAGAQPDAIADACQQSGIALVAFQSATARAKASARARASSNSGRATYLLRNVSVDLPNSRRKLSALHADKWDIGQETLNAPRTARSRDSSLLLALLYANLVILSLIHI